MTGGSLNVVARCCRWGAAFLTLVYLASAGGTALAQPPELTLNPGSSKYAGEIAVAIYKSQILRSDSKIERILVGNPKVADVVPLTDHSFYVLGKALGSTNITVYGPNKSLVAVADVNVTYDTEELKRRLHELMPSENVEIRPAGDAVVLSGSVSDADKLSRALTLAANYAPGKVSNMLTVKLFPYTTLFRSFAEVQRSALKELGVNLTAAYKVTGGPTLNLATGITPFVPNFGTLSATYAGQRFSIDGVINALETRGVVKTLAEPDLIALSGDTASFLAGGEFPIPVVQSIGVAASSSSITVEFKPFGVSLAFTPTVLDDGLINLVVAPEVSAIDPTTSVTVEGITVPGITTRRAKTTVELREGQSFAIAGLLQNNFRDNINQYPFLGDIPILGSLFRSSSYINNNSELVIIVTPFRVQPTRPENLQIPTDHFIAPSEADFFLLGREESAATGYTGSFPAFSASAGSSSGTAEAGGIDGQFGHLVQ